jgi:hypothetical protein
MPHFFQDDIPCAFGGSPTSGTKTSCKSDQPSKTATEKDNKSAAAGPPHKPKPPPHKPNRRMTLQLQDDKRNSFSYSQRNNLGPMANELLYVA